MNVKINITVYILFLFSICTAQDQKKDKAVFIEPKNEFLEQIKEEIKKFSEKEEEPKKELRMNFEGRTLPISLDQFDTLWHQPPVSQGYTGTCWCFCTRIM